MHDLLPVSYGLNLPIHLCLSVFILLLLLQSQYLVLSHCVLYFLEDGHILCILEHDILQVSQPIFLGVNHDAKVVRSLSVLVRASYRGLKQISHDFPHFCLELKPVQLGRSS